MEYEIGKSSFENVWQFFRRLNKELIYNLAVLLLGIYSQEMKHILM